MTVTEVGRRLLGVRAPWELYGRADSAVVRIQLARGRVTTTAVPRVATTGPVSFVAGARVAIVRPFDPAAGYAVFDGQPARPLSGPLGRGGPAFPGPDPHHVWSAPGTVIQLATFTGRASTAAIRIPPGDSVFDAVADGTGHVLFPAVGGIYDADPGRLHRISTGSLVAVGPTDWLVQECDQAHRCAVVDIDRATGSRHDIAALAGTAQGLPIGTISPDGRSAALFRHGANGGLRFAIVDLRSGRQHLLRVIPTDDGTNSEFAWSPDGRRLFVVNCSGKLFVVDGHTGRTARVSLRLPHLLQLAIGEPTDR